MASVKAAASPFLPLCLFVIGAAVWMQRDRQQLTSALQRFLPWFSQQNLAGAPGLTSIYYNASVWTGDEQAPLAEAFACNATGHLSAVGSSAAMLALAGSETKLVNLQGSFVTPGLIDAHVHMLFGGSTLQQIDLRGVQSKQEFVAAVQEAADTARPGQWLLGHGWTEGSWGGALPSITWVDHVTPNNPLLLSRSDMHMALVNSAALRLARLSPEAESPIGGRVDKDSEGRLTGILADHAMTLVSKHIPKQTLQDKHRALQTASKHLLSKGVTTVCDMGSVQDADDAWDTMQNVYMPAAEDGALALRIMAMVPLPTWQKLYDLLQLKGTSHPKGRLHWGGVKDFVDGSLGSRTALMRQPYNDDPSTAGVRLTDQKVLQQLVTDAHAAGLQVAIHAIGDRANDELAALYKSLLPAKMTHGDSSNSSLSQRSVRRHRVEHAQHLSSPASLEAFREAGVVAVTNPLHLISDLGIIEARLGKGRAVADLAFPSKALMEAGVAVAFGSDWPVAPADPLATMHTAVNSDNLTLPSGASWGYGSSVSPDEALRGHTTGAAVACRLESEVGMLRPGLRADFTVFKQNLLDSLTGIADSLPDVSATFVDGVCAFGCSNFHAAPEAALESAAG